MSVAPRLLSKKYAAVIITGGSSGIGSAFIGRFHLLNKFLPVCNLSRTYTDTYLKSLVPVLTHISADLTQSDELERIVPLILQWLETKAPKGPILLINNSGFGGYGTVDGLDLEHQLSMIDLNVKAMVHLTGRLLPTLRARGGDIMNVASTAAFQPTPFLATYGATKAFVLNWSLALSYELQGSGVRALCLCPGPTESNFFRRAGLAKGAIPGNYGQTAEQVVDTALRMLARKQQMFVVSGFLNKVMAAVSRRLPLAMLTRSSGRVMQRIRKPQAK